MRPFTSFVLQTPANEDKDENGVGHSSGSIFSESRVCVWPWEFGPKPLERNFPRVVGVCKGWVETGAWLFSGREKGGEFHAWLVWTVFRANSEQLLSECRMPSSEQIPSKFQANSEQVSQTPLFYAMNLLGWLITNKEHIPCAKISRKGLRNPCMLHAWFRKNSRSLLSKFSPNIVPEIRKFPPDIPVGQILLCSPSQRLWALPSQKPSSGAEETWDHECLLSSLFLSSDVLAPFYAAGLAPGRRRETIRQTMYDFSITHEHFRGGQTCNN